VNTTVPRFFYKWKLQAFSRNIEHFGPIVTSIGVGSIAGFAIGYAAKKIFKISLALMGILFGAIAYLQTQGVLSVNWDKIESISSDVATTVSSMTINQLGTDSMISSLGLPLMGSMSMGFAVGFMRG
jgi:uncharacterized membrane protein (Fun14 family)